MIIKKPDPLTLKTLKQFVQFFKSDPDKMPPSDKIWQRMLVPLPEHLATEGRKSIRFVNDEVTKIHNAVEVLSEDLGFEYIKKEDLKKCITELAIRCCLPPKTNPIPEFIKKHFKQPESHRVFVAIDGIRVKRPIKLRKTTLCPFKWIEKRHKECKDFQETSCVAMLDMVGTDNAAILGRAIDLVEHELRMLRVMLGRRISTNNSQLRFRIGREYAIKNRVSGWKQYKDTISEVELDHKRLGSVIGNGYNLFKLDPQSKSSICQKALMSAHWIEQSQKSTDLKMQVLYEIFALEALFGRRGEKGIGKSLGYRCTVLSLAMEGVYMADVTLIPRYYEIRSKIAHGKSVKPSDVKDVKRLTPITRKALSQYLQLAYKHNFTRAKEVYNYIDNHEDSLCAKQMFGLLSRMSFLYSGLCNRIVGLLKVISRCSF